MKPLETEYANVRFRSRTEARWAVFFDMLKVPWRYEHEGFDLPSGPYLPDFWLPDQKIWVEVKPAVSTDEEALKARELAIMTLHPAFIVYPEVGYWTERDRDHKRGRPAEAFFSSWASDFYEPCLCPRCGRFGFAPDGRPALMCGVECWPEMNASDSDIAAVDRYRTSDHPRIAHAVALARGARFWDPPRAA